MESELEEIETQGKPEKLDIFQRDFIVMNTHLLLKSQQFLFWMYFSLGNCDTLNDDITLSPLTESTF